MRDVPYREGTNPAWRLDLAVPKDTGTRKRPAIVIIHGGGWIEGDKSSFSDASGDGPANIVSFAKRGYVAATINYRLAREAPYPAALEDCRSAVRWLRANAATYHIDRDHIGAYGNSAGGHLSLLLGLTEEQPAAGDAPHGESSRVQAVVSDSGPVDGPCGSARTGSAPSRRRGVPRRAA